MTKDQIDEIGFWMKELEDVTVKLTPWELNFLESVSDRFTNTGSLSQRQYEVLKGIYEKRTS